MLGAATTAIGDAPSAAATPAARNGRVTEGRPVYEKALLALDGSERSRSAIPHARRATDGEVLLLQVIDSVGQIIARTTPSELSGDLASQLVQAERTAARHHLEAAASELREAGVATATVTVREGVPGAEIVRLAEEEGCDVIVLSTHGRSGISRMILGSVADYVVHHVRDQAVLLVHTSEDP